jgi:hypothetical protein
MFEFQVYGHLGDRRVFLGSLQNHPATPRRARPQPDQETSQDGRTQENAQERRQPDGRIVAHEESHGHANDDRGQTQAEKDSAGAKNHFRNQKHYADCDQSVGES